MKLDDLDMASKLKRREAEAKSVMTVNDNGKRELGENDLLEVHTETPYLLLLGQNGVSASGIDSDFLRTGRWTEEETAYVDFLVEAFDRGQLVMPQGMRLNDMLRDLLLCKASRLTKKMKHAKLSARSYDIKGDIHLNRVMLSTLEQQFVESITPEATRLELRCIVSKTWRSFLSNLCLQIGSEMLNVNDWVTSIETVETRASEAEKTIRLARRRRMGMALKTDIRAAPHGVFISGMPPSKRAHNRDLPNKFSGESGMPPTGPTSAQSVTTSTSSQGDHDSEFISQILDFDGNDNPVPGMMLTNANMEDMTMFFDKMSEKPPSVATATTARTNCGPFLEAIASFVETRNLPFEHIDVWVPSYHNVGNNDGSNEMRLFHAGYVTRGDIDPSRFAQLNEYGEYSTKFSFKPGCGLPGRVYTTGEPSWEREISDVDPSIFERAGGARVYGLNTGLGLPLSTSSIGCMVVVMYSNADMAEDRSMMQMCLEEFRSYEPEPKWKLVVDMPLSHKQTRMNRSTSVNSVNSSATSKSNTLVDPQEEEHCIATLLGDHIPLVALSGPFSETAIPFLEPDMLIPHFMSLRLLLLRSSDRRAVAENEAVEIIRKSYRGYARDARRAEKEIAFLLARDWQFLQQSNTSTAAPSIQKPMPHQAHVPPLQPPSSQYTSHQFGVPTNLSTYASSGAPTRMPSKLSFVDPSMVSRKNSIDDNAGMKRSTQSGQHNVNIVDEATD